MARIELRPEDVTAIVDTREQLPLDLSPLKTVKGTLDTGDYSVRGLEHHVSIERKSLPDYVGCIGAGRERFEREMARILAFPVRAVIIEASWADLEKGDWLSKVTPASVIGSTLGWISRGVPMLLTGSRWSSERAVSRMLFLAAKHQWEALRGFQEALKLA